MLAEFLADPAVSLSPDGILALDRAVRSGEPMGFLSFGMMDDEEVPPYRVEDGVALIDIAGPLFSKCSEWARWWGIWDYQAIADAVLLADADPLVSAIHIDWHSPGGHSVGADDCAAALGKVSKPARSYTRTAMCSAAYHVGSVFPVGLARDATVGSIGTYVVRADLSEALAKEGIKYEAVVEGEQKLDGAFWQPMSEAERARTAARVFRLADMFRSRVSKSRGISKADLKAFDGAVFIGSDAKSAGLADDIFTLEESVAEARRMARRTARASSAAVVAHAAPATTSSASAGAPEQPAILTTAEAPSPARTEGVMPKLVLTALAAMAGLPEITEGNETQARDYLAQLQAKAQQADALAAQVEAGKQVAAELGIARAAAQSAQTQAQEASAKLTALEAENATLKAEAKAMRDETERAQFTEAVQARVKGTQSADLIGHAVTKAQAIRAEGQTPDQAVKALVERDPFVAMVLHADRPKTEKPLPAAERAARASGAGSGVDLSVSETGRTPRSLAVGKSMPVVQG
ncbi:MAG TPA: S49 family peptidase [bacterium]|nr:S49 family peptidase [bacterium]